MLMMTLFLLRLVRRAFDSRAAFGLLPIVALAASALPAQPQQAAAGSTPPVPREIKVQYTGRLFGYYRVEPDANLDDLLHAYDAEVLASKTNASRPLALL